MSPRRATIPSPKSVAIAMPTKVTSKSAGMNSGWAKAKAAGTANNNRRAVSRLATGDYRSAIGNDWSAIGNDRSTIADIID